MPEIVTVFLPSATRSRRGCVACRTRRKKCDESRPACGTCRERGDECVFQSTKKAFPSRRRGILAKATPPSTESHKNSTSNAVSLSPSSTEGRYVFHFRNHLISLINFSRHGIHDPFLAHILPLTTLSPVVRSSVEAVAAAHLSNLTLVPSAEPVQLHNKSLQLLRKNLAQGDGELSGGEELATASILLVYYEIILGYSAKTSRCHLLGTKSFLDNLTRPSQPSSFTLFLTKLFIYFDIMVAFSLREPPLCDRNSRLYSMVMVAVDTVDPIFGLAGPAWASLYDLAEICARRAKAEEVTSAAQTLALKLRNMDPRSKKAPELPISDESYESLCQIANAHRCSALLVLYTDVLADEGGVSPDFVDSLYDGTLNSLLRASVLASDMMLTTIWPLHTVGMRATRSGDQAVIRKIFEKVSATHSKRCVDSAWEEVERCWEVGGRHEMRRTEILFA